MRVERVKDCLDEVAENDEKDTIREKTIGGMKEEEGYRELNLSYWGEYIQNNIWRKY